MTHDGYDDVCVYVSDVFDDENNDMHDEYDGVCMMRMYDIMTKTWCMTCIIM